jgi:hypothetical protein
MAFLLKRRDGRDIAKKRYCPVQNGTYGQPMFRITQPLQSVMEEYSDLKHITRTIPEYDKYHSMTPTL